MAYILNSTVLRKLFLVRAFKFYHNLLSLYAAQATVHLDVLPFTLF